MKTSLVDLVKATLSRMNSDQIVAIDDTEESRQVALICRHVYEELEVIREWGHKTRLAQLEANGVNEVTLSIPDDLNNYDGSRILSQIHSVQYRQEASDGTQTAEELQYISPQEMLDKWKVYDSPNDDNLDLIFHFADNGITTGDGQQMVFDIRNDKAPEYWTSIDDYKILFDSYDSSVDASGIDRLKTIVLAQVLFAFDETDDDLDIRIPDRDWPLYRNMVLSRAYMEIKQTNHPGADQVVRRLMIRAQKSSNHTTDRGHRGVNYGR